MPEIRCTVCGHPYPQYGLPYRCISCNGVFDYDAPPEFDINKIDHHLPGIFRYYSGFDLFHNAPYISLGEGNTPLIWKEYQGRRIGLKLEHLNPTGSYKDRGSAVLMSQLLARKSVSAVEDSSGNAGASFAAYAARAGLKARVYVPGTASGPKRRQIESYGAELISVPGPRSNAAQAVLEYTASGTIYASHAYLPFGLEGIATIAYELWEALGGCPGTVIAPVGHGGLLLGVVRGFSALHQKGLIKGLPFYVGAQAEACSPVVQAFHSGLQVCSDVSENQTVAEGVRVCQPVRASALLKEISMECGTFISIPEGDILPACSELAHGGIYVEPTSALAWAVLSNHINTLPDPVIVIMTGSGLKYYPES